MENTLENKARFFAQYWGQKIMAVTVNENDFRQKIGSTNLSKHHLQHCHIELKNIDLITNEDAQELGFNDSSDFFLNGSVDNMMDDLRLLGYAVCWADFSVDVMTFLGWIKLKTD